MPEPIAELLAAYATGHPDEAETVELFTSFLRDAPDCFDRSCGFGHFTASAWIVSAGSGRVLLTHHKKLGRWLQPGGHADGERDLAAVALREAVEETGLRSLRLAGPAIFDLDRHAIPARNAEPEHFHYDVRFLVRSEGDDRYTVSDESHDLAWVPLGDLERYGAGESILRMARKAGPARDRRS